MRPGIRSFSIMRRETLDTISPEKTARHRVGSSAAKLRAFASRPAFYLFVLGCLAVGVLFVSIGQTATPPGGTLTDANDETNPLTYTSGPFFVSNATAQANGTPICNAATQCDDYMLTVNVSAGVAATKNVKIQIQWATSTADFDLYVLDSMSNVVSQSASSADPETAFITAVPITATTYTVRVAPFAPLGQSITGRISLVPKPVPPPPAAGLAPRYKNYVSPPGGGDSAGEPSIGVDWNPNVASLKHGTVNTGGVAFFTANAAEFRANFDDCSSPAKHTWENVTSPQTSAGGLDPIGFVDHFGASPTPGRVFQSQLAAAAGSILAYSDDDGQTWTPSQGAGQPAGVDHQTIGGGPYSTMGPGGVVPPHPTYPNAIYYASQDAATAFCARSDNGGLTFGPGVPIYNLTQCGGIHGHIKVAPDGTVYIPNRGCSVGTGAQGVAVSTDNGLTWTVRTVPGSTSSDGDPSVGIATDGTVYFGFQNGDGHPHLAVSHDRGLTWADQDVSGQANIQNCVFPEVVAGDPQRAAFGFLGTTTPGNYQDTTNFHGVWYFFIVTTYDGGNTFITVNGTPNDPAQVGSICTAGTTCGNDRNLLDFNDITIDKEGRVLAAFADGCVAPGCTDSSPSAASRSAKATIIRQSGGRRLLAAFDPVEPAPPPAPRLISALKDSAGVVTVRWDEPDDAGSPLTNYKVYRGTVSGGETLLATISAASPKYIDSSGVPTTQYFYRVTAVNAQGEGAFCGELATTAAPPPETPCRLPGLTMADDPAGDQTGAPANSELDITKISIAEPFLNSCSNQLVFTIKVSDLTVVPPQARWTMFFTRTNNGMSTEYFVSMNSDNTGNPTGVTFNYGHTSIGTGGVRTLTTDGVADTGSTFGADGTIVILISNSKLTFNLNPPPATLPPPGPGEQFTNVNAITQQTIGVLLATLDSTGSNSYTLVGNRFCEPNNPPVASLSATPTTGDVPLIVSFDASGSFDSDLCDTVAAYTFNFDDGSGTVVTPTPTIMHTYNAAGQYRATVKAIDSRGLISSNTASVNIEVDNCLSTSTVSSTGGCFTGDAFNGTVDVTAENGCGWIATSNDTWITITGGGSGSGNGTVSYSLAANPTRTRRQGTMTIAGHTFTALQGVTFLDVPMSNVFYTDIGKISAKGITVGCDSQNYCPAQSVTRAEMAVFIIRALGIFNPPPPASQRFADVSPSNFAYAFIEELARRGITVGCNASNYCPNDPVTREQMAAFIIRALGEFNPPPPASQRFQDVPPSNQFYAFIDRLAALNITMGCTTSPPLLYCPSSPVPREQMAAFLNRAFGCP